MIKDDTKEQISLFDLPDTNEKQATVVVTTPTGTKREVTAANPARSAAKRTYSNKDTARPAERQTKRQETAGPAARVQLPRGMSGAVPEGDVRLTANIRHDLHLKLKITAATRRTTIGELLEDLVEQYL